jgi:uncharacterized membrane protein YeaQ/YmgE (transglycosylase-associated protein family)
MDLLLWIVFGGIVGWVASLIMRTDSQQGIFLNIVVGIIGTFLGGWLMQVLNINQGVTGFNLSSFFVSLTGAVVLIVLVKVVQKATS